jgi:divalent metal cation (Fe/Co/Zn/Cd) transporter
MGLFKSKKFLVALGGVIAVVLSHFFGIAQETVMEIVALLVAFIIGQGAADVGKEAAKIKNNGTS